LLTLTNVRITGNGGSGSVIYFLHGTLTIVDSLIDNNSVTGLRVAGSDASATVINTAIYNNTATFDGGGISNSGTLRLANSTISGNSARQNGGGVYSGGTVELYNVTIANNQADSDAGDDGLGGGLYISSGATLLARNTLIANNLDNSATTQHPNCSGTLNSLGYNLIEDTTGCTITGFSDGNVLGVDPALGPLQNNGGRTFTHALLAGSLAVNGGDPAGCRDYDNALLTTDQRVFARNGVCDIGAFEYNSPGPATPTATPTATHTPTATLTPISPTVTATPTTTVSPTPNSEPPADYSVYLPLIQK
jgi:predicted outer membrane repeat protein